MYKYNSIKLGQNKNNTIDKMFKTFFKGKGSWRIRNKWEMIDFQFVYLHLSLVYEELEVWLNRHLNVVIFLFYQRVIRDHKGHPSFFLAKQAQVDLSHQHRWLFLPTCSRKASWPLWKWTALRVRTAAQQRATGSPVPPSPCSSKSRTWIRCFHLFCTFRSHVCNFEWTWSIFITLLPLQPVGEAAFSSMILFLLILSVQTISSGFSLDVDEHLYDGQFNPSIKNNTWCNNRL